MSDIDENIQALHELIKQGESPRIVDSGGLPYAIVKNGYAVQCLEHLLARPVLKRATPVFTNVTSFIHYVNEQKSDQSRIYVPTPNSFVAILDHHEAKSPKADWRQHRATYNLTLTPQWCLWTQKNNCKFGQRDFAQFIEENQDDVTTPVGADLLDLVRTIKATMNAEFNGVVDEKDGNFSLAFQQQTRNTAGAKGNLELPQKITITLAPYEGSDPLPIEARLRFEVNNANKLNLWYELIRVDRVLRIVLQGISDSIETTTELPVWYGTP